MKSTQFLIVAFLALMCACHFKISVPVKYYSDEELISYAKENQYPFDIILRYPDYSKFSHRRDNGVFRVNFVNLYDKDNTLIKAADDDNCEFKIAAFIEDSLQSSHAVAKYPISLTSLLDSTYIVTNSSSLSLRQASSKYKVVVGWTISLNKYGVIKKRLQLLNERLGHRTDFVMVGLNLDMPIDKSKS